MVVAEGVGTGAPGVVARTRDLLERTLLGPALVAAGSAGALLLANRVDPNEAGHYPTCPFLALSGLYCPGCGSTRMVHALSEADLGEALAMNPLALALLPALVLYWAGWTRRVVTGAPRRSVMPAWVVWGFLVVVVSFWVLRNVPATSWLAPG